MAKKHKRTRPKLDPLSFLHQPHDKYARFVLQTKAAAVQLMQFCLPERVAGNIEFGSMELSDDSFIDARLRNHFSDICYRGKTKQASPIQISIIIEHKSAPPDTPITEQLLRYISNIWHNDIRQKRRLSLTIPILLYHGERPLEKEDSALLFPDAPQDLLPYVPSFAYAILDIANITDTVLENLNFLLLRNILLALKHSRNADYIDKYWEKIVIFAPTVRSESISTQIWQATILYLGRTSKVFNKKIKEMDNLLSTSEKLEFKPFFLSLIEEGMEKGIEKGIEKGKEQGIQQGMAQLLSSFIRKNPDVNDKTLAELFDIDESLVRRVRAQIQLDS